MKIILVLILSLLYIKCSQAETVYHVTCENPFGFSTDQYSDEVQKANTHRDGTRVLFKDGSEKYYSPNIKCIVETKDK